MPPARAQCLPAAKGPAALAGVSTLILDCDGVLWRGTQLIPHTGAALEAFRAKGLRLLFLTNNSSKSRVEYAHKFASLGIDVAPEEIVPSSYTAAAYLKQQGLGERKLFAIGNGGLKAELEAAGVGYVDWVAVRETTGLHDGWTHEQFEAMEIDPSICGVVVGWDPAFDYSALCYATACLLEVPGSVFVATNADYADKAARPGRFMPGTGCSVAALEAATGRQAVNCGKGGTWLLPWLCAEHGIEPSQACIVGDRLDTDIAVGRQGGLRTVLPLSGVTDEAALAAADPAALPDFVCSSLATLAGIK